MRLRLRRPPLPGRQVVPEHTALGVHLCAVDTPAKVIIECDGRGCGSPIARLSTITHPTGWIELQVARTPTMYRMRRELRVRRAAGDLGTLRLLPDGLVTASDDHVIELRPVGEAYAAGRQRYRLWCEGRTARPHQVVRPVVATEQRLRDVYTAAIGAGRRHISLRELR